MKIKIFKIMGIAGIVVNTLLWVLSLNIYELLDRGIFGILLGAVNSSIWEMGKGLWLSYILYAFLQLIISRPNLKHFVVAKFFGLYAVMLCYIALRNLFPDSFSFKTNLIIGIFSLSVGYLLSYKLTLADYPLKYLYPTACLMILLLFVFSFSFTAFTPEGILFQDPETELYGIIPDYIDVGAVLMDKIWLS